MILIKTIFTGILLSAFAVNSSIYDYNVPKIEGGNQSILASQGKKILIITLPVQQNIQADSLLYCLDTLAAARQTTSSVIAVPSYEDGYQPSQKEQLKNWYRSKLGSYISITDGLYTRKSSAGQHDLFKWLTDIEKNGTFDMDVEGPGHKFFVRENGELYGSLVPETKMGGKAVQKTLQMP